jgi:hypothetical protein
MNLPDIISKMFPAGTVNGRGCSEVNCLPKGTEPRNCEVLLRGMEKNSRGDRREFYLVRSQGVLFYLRICTAMPGSGYDEFVVIHASAICEAEQAKVEAYARSRMDYLQPVTCLFITDRPVRSFFLVGSEAGSHTKSRPRAASAVLLRAPLAREAVSASCSGTSHQRAGSP